MYREGTWYEAVQYCTVQGPYIDRLCRVSHRAQGLREVVLGVAQEPGVRPEA
jgi:hypothetical protein